MTESDFKEIGISTLGARRKLQIAILGRVCMQSITVPIMQGRNLGFETEVAIGLRQTLTCGTRISLGGLGASHLPKVFWGISDPLRSEIDSEATSVSFPAGFRSHFRRCFN